MLNSFNSPWAHISLCCCLHFSSLLLTLLFAAAHTFLCCCLHSAFSKLLLLCFFFCHHCALQQTISPQIMWPLYTAVQMCTTHTHTVTSWVRHVKQSHNVMIDVTNMLNTQWMHTRMWKKHAKSTSEISCQNLDEDLTSESRWRSCVRV